MWKSSKVYAAYIERNGEDAVVRVKKRNGVSGVERLLDAGRMEVIVWTFGI